VRHAVPPGIGPCSIRRETLFSPRHGIPQRHEVGWEGEAMEASERLDQPSWVIVRPDRMEIRPETDGTIRCRDGRLAYVGRCGHGEACSLEVAGNVHLRLQ
jgi:hypothetical protein